MTGLTHGLASAYRSGGCRCDECKKAHRERHKAERQQRQQRLAAADVEHGTASTYRNWGCRCRPCTVAQSRDCAEYKARRKAEEAA